MSDLELSFATYTDQGGRTCNEDALAVRADDSHSLCAVLADGLGGHGGGDVAAQASVKAVADAWEREMVVCRGSVDLSAYVQTANSQVRELQTPTCRMQTTIVALSLANAEASWCYVGDSRLYAFREGRIVWQSLDHSASQLAVLMGQIQSSEIRHHEDRSRLYLALGQQEVKPAAGTIELRPGLNAFLLCSDGFWEYVLEEEMEQALVGAGTPEDWLALSGCEVSIGQTARMETVNTKVTIDHASTIDNAGMLAFESQGTADNESYPIQLTLSRDARIANSGELWLNAERHKLWGSIQNDGTIYTLEELHAYYVRNLHNFGAQHLRSYYYFERYLNQLIHPTSYIESDEQDYSIETVMNTYLSMRMPSGRKRANLSLVQRLIKQNWPNATAIKNVRNHVEDVPRKLLLLLYVVTENVGFDPAIDEPSDVEPTLEDRVSDHWWTLNAILADCGMAQMDLRNAFDWLIVYAIAADPDEMMSERMERVISDLYGES